MAWISLFLAGVLEVIWLMTMKNSSGFTKPFWTVVTIITMIVSFALLSFSLKTIPAGTAYAIWTGIGAVGAATVGIIFYHESKDVWRLLSIVLIVAGIVGLKLTAKV